MGKTKKVSKKFAQNKKPHVTLCKTNAMKKSHIALIAMFLLALYMYGAHVKKTAYYSKKQKYLVENQQVTVLTT